MGPASGRADAPDAPDVPDVKGTQMLAESEAANVLIFVVIMVAIVVGRIVEYLRKKKAEQEAKERKLRGARTEGREHEAAGSEPEPENQPAVGGLQALLDALQGRESEAAEPSEERGEVWDVADESTRTGEHAMDPATLKLERERARDADAARWREASTPALTSAATYEEQVETGIRIKEPAEAVAPAPAHAAAGLFAGPGDLGNRDQARRGILWSVVLGPPRGTVPYGERGASEAPGGVT